MIAFHAERRASFSGVIPLARYEPERSLWGTRIWAVEFTLDPGEYLLQTGGRTLITHLALPLPGTNDTSYAIYGNCRVVLWGASTADQLPPDGTIPPESLVIALDGENIRDHIAHYANVNAAAQKQISGGVAYRVEVWCASGTDAWDVDGLGGLKDYNCGNIHQFNVRVDRL